MSLDSCSAAASALIWAGVVESHVGHGPVQAGNGQTHGSLLHGGHLGTDDGLDGLDGVVGGGQLESVKTDGALDDLHGVDASHLDSVAAASAVQDELVGSSVLGQDDLLSALDGDDPVRVADDLADLIEVVLCQVGNSRRVDCVGHSGDGVLVNLLLRHHDGSSVTHSCYILHFSTFYN